MSADLGPDRPFPGLRPYEARDHEWFFGREEQSLSLYRLLERGRFIAVVGSSGSGKSSLVKAGLLPALAGECTSTGAPRWRIWELRPGDAPLARLTGALAGRPPEDGEEVGAFVHAGRRQRLGFVLRKSSFGLLDALQELALSEGTTPLLLVDQFEELFRFPDLPGTDVERNARRQEASAFVHLLLEATHAPDARLRVVLTLRSDYLGDCARFDRLPEAVTTCQFLVPSLTRDQREQAIRGPVEKAGGTITDELVERVLADTSEEQDQLPVLQHALMRTWNQSATAGRMTEADYAAVGGVSGAIAQHADALLEEPAVKGVGLAVEQVFRALAELDRSGRAIRRPLSYRQLVDETGPPEPEVRTVVDRFRRDDCSFLVPPFVEGQTIADSDVVDIAHEALIRRWTRMTRQVDGVRTGWLWDEVADGRTYVALLETARGAAPDQPALLPLDQVAERRSWWQRRPRTATWAERYGGSAGTVEKLLADSALALEKSRREREEAAAREAANARRETARAESRTSRREVLTRTQALAFLGVSLVAVAMNFEGLVYAAPPFSWVALVTISAVTLAIWLFSPSAEGRQTSGRRFRLSLDQTIWSYYLIDLLALAYLMPRSGGFGTSPFTIFLLVLPMNAVLLEEPFARVKAYFAGVWVLALALAAHVLPGVTPPAAPSRLALPVAPVVLTAIAFLTALIGYQRLDRQRRES